MVGISITTSHLAPFVRISKNHYKTYLSSFPYISKEDKERMINEMLDKEIKDSIQTLLYQLNSMHSSNGQSPFITIFCYIHENEEYLEENVALIKELLKQRIKGMEGPNGNNINPAFPKIIFVLDEDNINPGTKYYDVTKLAAECTCKRMVPDYISAKIMKKYKEGNVFPSINKSVA
jgi:ribonucleoside-triphosphate reductase